MDAVCTLASIKRLAKTEAKWAITQLWFMTAPASYNDLQISYSTKLDDLQLDRAVFGQILVACTHHGDFISYHTHFNHQDATLTCSCGYRKTQLHIYF